MLYTTARVEGKLKKVRTKGWMKRFLHNHELFMELGFHVIYNII